MDKADSAVLSSICRLSNMIRRGIIAAAPSGDFSGAEGRTLFFLLDHKEDKLVQKDIEQEYGLRPSTASQLLARMEKDGLITRSKNEGDQRLKYICLTQKALSYEKTLMNAQSEIIYHMTEGMSAEQTKEFCRVAQAMTEHLDKYVGAPAKMPVD